MAYVNIARFTAVSAGTGSFVVSAAVTGYQTPASAGATNATVYSYRAENASLTEWEIGTGTYTTGTVTLTRTPSASSNGGAAVNFTVPPQVAITALAADLASAASLTAGTLPAARLPQPESAALGGVFATTAVSNNFLTYISTAGAPTGAQPAFSNLSSGIAVSQMNSGTAASGTTYWRGDGTWVQPAFSALSSGIAVSQMNSGTSATATTYWSGSGTWTTPAGTGITAASSAEVETATSNTVGITPGRIINSPYVAKAWVKWGVTTTIDASVGVSSITDNGTGDWTVNWTTAFSSANYAIVHNTEAISVIYYPQLRTIRLSGQATGSVRVLTWVYDSTVLEDPSKNHVIAFGDQ